MSGLLTRKTELIQAGHTGTEYDSATHRASTSRAVLCRNSSFMAEVTAAWSSGSSRVAECLQMRLPCSSRLMHRQTYRRSPPGIHSTLR